MPTYYTIITDAGQALLADAIASGQPVVLTKFAVGDGGGVPMTPDPAMTALVNEVYPGNISSFETNPEQPNAMVAQLVIPKESGGYTVREVGLFTDDGTMFSIGNYPDQPKPPPESGYAVKLDLRYMLVVSDTSAITVVIPPGDYLTKEEADTLYLKIGFNLSEIDAAGEEAQEESRANLGCGTAATHDVTETPDDATAGRVLKTGDFGLGGFLSALNNTDVTGFHSKGVGHADNPEPLQGYAHINLGVSGSYKTVLAVSYTAFPRIFIRSSLDEVYQPWVELIGSNGSVETGAGSFDGQYGTKAPYYHEFTDAAPSSYHPLWKIKDLHNKNMWSGGILVNAGDFRINYDDDTGAVQGFAFRKDGQFIPPNYANLDARYLRMPSAGGVGDVALVKLNNSDQFLHGSTVPGSSLSYAGLQTASDGFDTDVVVESKVLPGTWRITGTMVTDPSAYQMKVTTAIRIA